MENNILNGLKEINSINNSINKKIRVKSRVLTQRDFTYIKNRLDSQSKRIRALNDHIMQNISNQRYYLNKRLPNVLKKERARQSFTDAFKKTKVLLGLFTKRQVGYLTKKTRDSQNDKPRYIGLFSNVEMHRLRQFLLGDHSQDYMLYRGNSYKKHKNKHLAFFTTSEIRRIRRLVNK